jgi:hypothetical protein
MGSRSSSRHGPAVQFSGRVRKWQKTWTKSETSEKLQVFKWLPKSGKLLSHVDFARKLYLFVVMLLSIA